MEKPETNEPVTEERDIFSSISARSDVTMEIIGYKPNFFEKWGILLFALIFLMLLILSAFFKYPDTVEGSAYLTAHNAPKTIIANQSGRLIKIFVKDNQEVEKTAIIGWIESPEKGKHAEIILLYKQLETAIDRFQHRVHHQDLSALFFPSLVNLGEIQNDYQTLITNINIYEEYQKGFFSEKRTRLIDDINALSKINQNIKQQEKILVETNDLAKESFEMNEKLFTSGVITREEYRQQKNKLLSNQMQLPTINSNIITNQSEQRDKITDIKSIDYTTKQQEQLIEQTLFGLKSKIDDWLNKYCIYSPIKGRFHFDKRIQEFQFLKAGDSIGFIFPNDNTLYAEIMLPQYNIGKVDTSMEVQLRFDAYPYQEFGSVVGKLISVSEIANENGFTGIVALKKGLETNQHLHIRYREGLQARAIVITKDMSMLKRFWYGIIKHVDVNSK